MVQIIPKNQPSFLEHFFGGVNKGMEKEHEFGKIAEQARFQKELQSAKQQSDLSANLMDYDTVKKFAGQDVADFYKAAPVGGKTKIVQAIIDGMQRGQKFGDMLSGGHGNDQNDIENISPDQIGKSPEQLVKKQLQEIKETQDLGLTPPEKVVRGKERYSTGLKSYQESGVKLRGSSRDKERLDILDNLNKKNNLPKDLGRLNVDKEGNLRFPFAASADAERYVKVLNEFSSGAKDTFGSRVTNFDLAQYLKRFPTLLNSSEGRKQLLQQMKIVNDINAVYYKNLKDVFDKAGGVRNIDSDVAERLAEELSEQKIQKLSEKFNQIGQFTSKPNASEFKGKRIRDKETGEVLVSDGENWIPE